MKNLSAKEKILIHTQKRQFCSTIKRRFLQNDELTKSLFSYGGLSLNALFTWSETPGPGELRVVVVVYVCLKLVLEASFRLSESFLVKIDNNF